MEVVHFERLLVGRRRVVAVADVKDILCHILLHDKPRTAAEAQALALPDGVEPQPLVRAYLLARFQFDDISHLLAKIATHVFVVVDVAQEADALTVASLGIDEVLALGNLAHLVLLEMSDGEESLPQLPTLDLCQEIRLVFHGVGTRCEPFPPVNPFRLRIMPRGDEVVTVAHLLIEGTELDESVTHHIRIRRVAGFHLLHRVAGHLPPIFLVAINHVQLTAKASRHGRSHLQVFLARTVPLLFFLGPYLDVEAVGAQAVAHHLVEHHAAVDAAREQQGRSPILYFVVIYHRLYLPFKRLRPTFMRSKPKP